MNFTMVSEQGNSKTMSVYEPKHSITSFHQCSSLVSIKLSNFKFPIVEISNPTTH